MDQEIGFQEEQPLDDLIPTFVVPSATKRLMACVQCHLIKTQEQWKRDASCDNCDRVYQQPFTMDRVTKDFESVLSVISGRQSWLRKKLPIQAGIVSGAYALFVHR